MKNQLNSFIDPFVFATMADQVQATLDRMVPALRDLLDRGIFTEVRGEEAGVWLRVLDVK